MRPLIGPKWRWWVIGLLCAWLTIGLVRQGHAETPFGAIDQLAGTFTQQLLDENEQLLTLSTGQFALLRPYYFRWDIKEPGRQLLVGDGEYLWQYDQDLDTVLRRPLADQLSSPLGVLLASEGDLEQAYEVTRQGATLRLTPRGNDPLFTSISVDFNGEVPGTLTLKDSLGQTIVLTLDISPDSKPRVEDFNFRPPSDADLTIVDS